MQATLLRLSQVDLVSCGGFNRLQQYILTNDHLTVALEKLAKFQWMKPYFFANWNVWISAHPNRK